MIHVSPGTPVRNAAASSLAGFCAGVLLACFCTSAAARDWLGPVRGLFGDDSVGVSAAGPGQFVKIINQEWLDDHRRPPDNEHPGSLSEAELTVVLGALKVAHSANTGTANVTLFSRAEVTPLAADLSKALSLARPDQDVVFAVAGESTEPGSAATRRSTAGRLFLHQGMLNIIFGDVLAAAAGDDSGDNYNAKPHRAGKREKIIDRSTVIAPLPGMTYWHNADYTRGDWIQIDVRKTLAAIGGPPPGRAEQAAAADATPTTGVAAQDAPANVDNSALLRERRELLEEVARLRKQVSAGPPAAAAPSAPVVPDGAGQAGSSADAADAGEVPELEQRLQTLKTLHDKKLITDQEYATKRTEILKEL